MEEAKHVMLCEAAFEGTHLGTQPVRLWQRVKRGKPEPQGAGYV